MPQQPGLAAAGRAAGSGVPQTQRGDLTAASPFIACPFGKGKKSVAYLPAGSLSTPETGLAFFLAG